MSVQGAVFAAAPAVARVLVSRDPALLEALSGAAAQLGWAPLAVAADEAGAAAAIGAGSPALLVVDLDALGDPVAAITRLAAVCSADIRVLALGSGNDAGLFRQLLALGVGDYLVKPLAAEALATALRPLAADPAVARGSLVAVIGGRGGCGTTTLATSLALIAGGGAMAGSTGCVLVDLDLHHGNAAAMFGLEPGDGLAALFAAPERLDERLLGAALQTAAPGVAVLAASAPLESEAAVPPDAALRLLDMVRATASLVIVDLPPRLDPAARQVLRLADQVVVVTTPTLDGVRETARLLDWLEGLRAGASPLLVINGASGGAGEIGRGGVEQTLGQQVTAWIPALPGPAAAAAAHGVPLAAVVGRDGQAFTAILAALGQPVLRVRRRWWAFR
jgi:pilus assembly protein CpaE